MHNPTIEYFQAPAEVHVGAVAERALELETAKSELWFREWTLKRLASTTSSQ